MKKLPKHIVDMQEKRFKILEEARILLQKNKTLYEEINKALMNHYENFDFSLLDILTNVYPDVPSELKYQKINEHIKKHNLNVGLYSTSLAENGNSLYIKLYIEERFADEEKLQKQLENTLKILMDQKLIEILSSNCGLKSFKMILDLNYIDEDYENKNAIYQENYFLSLENNKFLLFKTNDRRTEKEDILEEKDIKTFIKSFTNWFINEKSYVDKENKEYNSGYNY